MASSKISFLRSALVVGTCVLLVAACAEPKSPVDPETNESTGALEESSQPVSAPKEEQRSEDVTPGEYVEDVDWEEASRFRQIPAEQLDEELRNKIAQVPVPVLLPQVDELLEAAFITIGPHWYAASMSMRDHSVAIQGTRKAFFVPGVSDAIKDSPDTAHEQTLVRVDGIITLSFRRFGAAYNIDVECARPFEDERCTRDDYALSLLEKMAVAGGKR